MLSNSWNHQWEKVISARFTLTANVQPLRKLALKRLKPIMTKEICCHGGRFDTEWKFNYRLSWTDHRYSLKYLKTNFIWKICREKNYIFWTKTQTRCSMETSFLNYRGIYRNNFTLYYSLSYRENIFGSQTVKEDVSWSTVSKGPLAIPWMLYTSHSKNNRINVTTSVLITIIEIDLLLLTS